MEPEEHAKQNERLVRLVRDSQGPSGVFVPPVPELGESHYVDFTHLNAEGYRILARRLAETLRSPGK
jgi:hypothetical protein